jgi:hypothetical protein
MGLCKAGQTALVKRYETALGAYQVAPLSAAITCLAAQLRVQYRLKLPDAVQLAWGCRSARRHWSRMTGTFLRSRVCLADEHFNPLHASQWPRFE